MSLFASLLLQYCVVTCVSLIGYHFFIAVLRKFQSHQSNLRPYLEHQNSIKKTTPSMGGIIIALTVLILTPSLYTMPLSLFPLILFALIGLIDDLTKTKKLWQMKTRFKLLLQIGAAASVIPMVLVERSLHFLSDPVLWIISVLFATLVLVCITNAVNITDGLDGLASFTVLPCLIFLMIVAILEKKPEIAFLCVSLTGSLTGFLYFNRRPAQIFMGDIGSLFIGSVIGTIAIALRVEWFLILSAFIPTLNASSSLAQIIYYHGTHGKRLFKMAPLHHHLEHCGYSESKIVFIFSMLALVGAGIALALFLFLCGILL